ncbi:hypothetical protein EMCRGX_G011199 [Ephydatia muelleri]
MIFSLQGYTVVNDALEFRPFSVRLKKLLLDHLGCDVEVDNMGISGDCVVPYMADRLQKALSSASKKYDWIIILGGTNDLGQGVDYKTILATLCSMHDNARASGAHTLCLAITQAAMEHDRRFLLQHTNKLKVNAGLREYCDHSGGWSIFVDLYNELPHPTDGDTERNKYWCDPLHLTEHGYNVMADIIFSKLKEHLVVDHRSPSPKL